MQDAETKLALTGQKALVAGAANEHWIAYGCAKAPCTAGADVAVIWLNDRARPHVEAPVQAFEAPITGPLDVFVPGPLEAVIGRLRAQWGMPDILAHSIPFAPKEDLQGDLLNSSAKGFAKATDISCHSFVRVPKLAAPLMTEGGTTFAMSDYGANRVVPDYNKQQRPAPAHRRTVARGITTGCDTR